MKVNLSLRDIVQIADFAGLDFELKETDSWDMDTEYTITDEIIGDIKGVDQKGLKLYCTEYPEEGFIVLSAID